MKTARNAAAILLLVITALAAGAQTPVGVISYMEGNVEVSRNGDYLSPSDVEIGLSIEEFDTLETGADGYVEVELTLPSAGSAVKVQPDSTFYFETTPQPQSRFQTLFQLLKGSLKLKVGRLRAGETYGVQTDTAVMAVRGTEFNVDISPDRSVLITVPEGRVESKTDSRTIMAQPGTVAIITPEASMQALAVTPSDIELYRTYWRDQRLEALRINARLSIQQYAGLWDRQRPRLVSAMDEIKSNEAIFRKWERIAAGEMPSPGLSGAVRDKRTLSRGMLALRSILPIAERTFYTLTGLEEAWRDGMAEGAFQAGNYSNASAFYRTFKRDIPGMKRALAASRRCIRIYRYLDQAAGGGSDIMSGPNF